MKKVIAIGFCLSILFVITDPARAKVGDVLKVIPDLMADNDVGITYKDSSLWAAGHNGTLYQINPENGAVLSTIKTQFSHGLMGLSNDGNHFWVVNHQDGKIYEIDYGGNTVSSFSTPNTDGGTEKGVEGLTWDGKYFWYADSSLGKLYQMDKSGNIISQCNTPGRSAQGLTWDGSYLWHFDFVTHLIYQINPANGIVIQSFNAPYNGGEGDLAFDGVHLWFSTIGTKSLYQIDIGCSNTVAIKPYTFAAGKPAKADEVNANFDTLYQKINAPDCQIQSLQTQVQALKAIVCQDHPTADVCK